MQANVSLNDDLLAKSRIITGLEKTSDLVNAALTTLIERDSARRLARLGASEPHLTEAPPRRTAK